MGAKRDIKTMLFRFVLVATFCLLGAAIFYAIENTGEYNDEVTRKTRLYSDTKSNIMRRFGINYTEYENLVKKVVEARSYTPSQWSFARGLDLCMQTVTTIGYGNKTPTTLGGRLFLIPFALFGIPMTVLFLSTVGENLTHLIRFIIDKFEKKVLRRTEVKNPELKCMIAINAFSISLIFLMAAVSTVVDQWTFGQGLYVWFVTFTTIGFGDFIPGHSADSESGIEVVMYRLLLMILGLSLISTIFNAAGDFAKKRNSSALKLCTGCFSLRCCSKEGAPTEVREFELENSGEKNGSTNNDVINEKI